jgi:hypothetical protein
MMTAVKLNVRQNSTMRGNRIEPVILADGNDGDNYFVDNDLVNNEVLHPGMKFAPRYEVCTQV